MGDPKGFLKYNRRPSGYRAIQERVHDYKEILVLRNEERSMEQAARCMDCGTPFCHWGCTLGNFIPEWNDYIFNKRWKKAYELLQATNNFPEFTGRVCPALCESACVLGINDDAVTIKDNEVDIVEYAFKKGWIKPNPPKNRTGKKVAVVGSGPAGLAVADQLNKAGHLVTVFERDDKIGGLIRYGIPDFKLNKKIIDRRLNILQKEGIKFVTNTNIGVDFDTDKLLKEFDAVCLTGGSKQPRDLNIECRKLNGIYFAMDYLKQSNQRVAGYKIPQDKIIDAKNKNVVVIGGGDTGSDCVGTANRQGAERIVQIEVLPKPSETRTDDFPWPVYPMVLKTSTSHKEGCERYWSVLTKKFIGDDNGNLKRLLCVKVDFSEKDESGKPVMKEVPNSEFELEADLVFLAVGFVHPEHTGLLEKLGVELDNRGNVKTDKNYMTSVKGVFSAGDMHTGQSLVLKAISEGRRSAHYIDKYLTGDSKLPLL